MSVVYWALICGSPGNEVPGEKILLLLVVVVVEEFTLLT